MSQILKFKIRIVRSKRQSCNIKSLHHRIAKVLLLLLQLFPEVYLGIPDWSVKTRDAEKEQSS